MLLHFHCTRMNYSLWLRPFIASKSSKKKRRRRKKKFGGTNSSSGRLNFSKDDTTSNCGETDGGRNELFYKRTFRCPRIWYTLWLVNFDGICQHSSVTCANKKCEMAVTVNGVDGPTRLTRFVILVHSSLSFWSLDLSLFQTCLWRALNVVLLGPGCFIRTV